MGLWNLKRARDLTEFLRKTKDGMAELQTTVELGGGGGGGGDNDTVARRLAKMALLGLGPGQDC
jgi:hypothetical protein